MRRCVWCGELRDRLALPDDGRRMCKCCMAYASQRAQWYGETLPSGLAVPEVVLAMKAVLSRRAA